MQANYKYIFGHDWLLSSVGQHTISMRELGVRSLGQSNRTQCRQRLDSAAMFFAHSIRATAEYREYNENIIFFLLGRYSKKFWAYQKFSL